MLIINPAFLRYIVPWCIWKGRTENRTVYLTFDDGPHPKYTPVILDILHNFKADGAFFITGQNAMHYPGLVERIHSESHVIGNHGFSHRSLAFRRRSVVFEEIRRTDQLIHQITGSVPRLFRPPYGRFDSRFKAWMKKLDHQMVLWSLLTGDFREHSPELLQTRIQEHIHPGAIILMHDGLPATPNLIRALPGILDALRRQDYHFTSSMDLAG